MNDLRLCLSLCTPWVRFARCVVCLICALFLGACGLSGAVAPASPTSAAPTAVAATVAPTAVPTPSEAALLAPTAEIGTPLPDDLLLLYHRSGCFDGINEVLRIHTDGSVDLTDRTGNVYRDSVHEAQLAKLRDAIASQGFAEAQPSPPTFGADLCTYSVTTTIDHQSRTLTTTDGATDSAALAEVIGQLEALRGQMPSCSGRCH